MKTFFLIFLFIYSSFSALFAQKSIDLSQHIESSYIGKHISCFQDKDHTASINSIISSTDISFTPCNTDIINFGFSRSDLWLKFVVTGYDSLSEWILEIRSPNLESVTFYYKAENGIWKEKNEGSNWPFYNREMNTRNIAFKLPHNLSKTAEYYIKIKSTGSITVPVKLERENFFVSENMKWEVLYGFCYGILVIILFTNLFIFFSIKQMSYFFYVLFVASSILFYGFYYGHIPQYITHIKSPAINYLMPLFFILLAITSMLFFKSFLNLAKFSLFFNRLINIIILLFFLNIVILFIDPVLATWISQVLSFFTAIIVFIASVVFVKKGNREARFFIIGTSFYVVTIIIAFLMSKGFSRHNEFTIYRDLVGHIVDVLLLSVGLASKLNRFRIEKELDQIQLIKLRDQNVTVLEQKVKERTTQLEHANEDMNIINKDLEAFSYSASHDLRAPLRSIIGFTAILEKNSKAVLSEDSKGVLNIISSSAKNMDKLIEDLLAFSRLGKKELVKEEINMKELIEKVITELRLVSNKEQIIDIKIGQIENFFGDPILLKQVWVNLISNSIKYSMKKSKTEIEIASKISDNEVTYWIKDNGAGFDMKHADQLFQPFKRLHGQTEFEGTGLGLSIVKRILTKHGGKIWAEGREGEGATFYFNLPLATKSLPDPSKAKGV